MFFVKKCFLQKNVFPFEIAKIIYQHIFWQIVVATIRQFLKRLILLVLVYDLWQTSHEKNNPRYEGEAHFRTSVQ